MTPGNDLQRYGWSKAFAREAAAFADEYPARVISQAQGLYRAVTQQGELTAELCGRLRHEAVGASYLPAVGDFVMLDRLGDQNGNAAIRRVLSRKSAFVRKAAGSAVGEQVVAANIDTVFVCMSLNRDFNLRRLERYLSIAWSSGATPVVVLTKADLCDDAQGMRAAAQNVCMGADVLVASSMARDGYEGIRAYLREGETVALIGSSGVGKSTLINRMTGGEALRTGELRGDDRGRHTTTRRELLALPGGGVMIDTPGMRELGLWDDADGVDRAFAEVEELAGRCRFGDCTHESEPGCAVQAAIRMGALAPQRLASYRKLKQEALFARDQAGYLERKEEWAKGISKLNKARRK